MTAIMEKPPSLACSPRWATPRNPARETRGGEVARISQALGTPLMWWQRLVADVAMEIDPFTGRLVYRKVVLTVPRQSGKTTLILGSMVHRGLVMTQVVGKPQKIVYTAQKRLKARQKWEDEHIPIIQRSPFAGLMLPPRRQIGQEAIRWRNGSLHGLDAPSKDAVHGEVLDEGVIDEAFAQADDRLEQGMKPAMLTRNSPQLWVPSTAGKSKTESRYLWGEIEAGRLAVETGIDTGTAYFEWSAPHDADPGDEDVWIACMPGLEINGGLIPIEAIRSDYQSWVAKGALDEFRRAYLNQWVDEQPHDWQVIGEAAWTALTDLNAPRPDNPAFAVDITPDRSWGCIAVAGGRWDGNTGVEIVAHDRGTSWIIPKLLEIQSWEHCAIVIAPFGPAARLIDEAEAVGLEIWKPSLREYAAACTRLYDGCGVNPTDPAWLRHPGDPALNAAVAGCLRRALGQDGAWMWSRKGITVDISPLVAVTLALAGFVAKAHTNKKPPPLRVF